MKFLGISILALIIFLGFGLILFNKSQTQKILTPTPSPLLEDQHEQDKKVNIKATFTIITGNITRSFKAEKYHNQSLDVYIENPDPTIVHVTKANITWDNFFKTLPMKLSKECLITGDGETLCNGKSGTLKFYLNDIESPDLLDRAIKESDQALIKFFI